MLERRNRPAILRKAALSPAECHIGSNRTDLLLITLVPMRKLTELLVWITAASQLRARERFRLAVKEPSRSEMIQLTGTRRNRYLSTLIKTFPSHTEDRSSRRTNTEPFLVDGLRSIGNVSDSLTRSHTKDHTTSAKIDPIGIIMIIISIDSSYCFWSVTGVPDIRVTG